MQRGGPLLIPSGKGVLDPGTGRPMSDTYFAAFNTTLADKGFLVTAADNLIMRAAVP
jgi:NADH-quinone oxidoreductase subunit B